MLNSSKLLIPLQKTDETGNYSLMNLKSLQLALPFPINSVQRPPRLVLHFMIHETAYYIIFFQGLTLLIKISKMDHEGNELELPQLLALSQSESVLQIYKEFEKQLDLTGPRRQELLRSLYFILIIYLRKKYQLEGPVPTLPWNFELESGQSSKAIQYVTKLALPFEQKKSIAYQRLLALDYDKKSSRYANLGISQGHLPKGTAVNNNPLSASIPLGYIPTVPKPETKQNSYVSIARQLNSIGQENKFSVVPYNPIVIPELKKASRKYSCDDQSIYDAPLTVPQAKTSSPKNENESKPKESLGPLNPLLRVNKLQLQNLIKKLSMEAPLLRKVEHNDPERSLLLFKNIILLHSQKLIAMMKPNPVQQDSRRYKSLIPDYITTRRFPALTYEIPKCICYPTQSPPEAPAQAGSVHAEASPAQSATRRAASHSQRKCLTYEKKLALGYEPRLALTYKPLLALTYTPILAIGYKPDSTVSEFSVEFIDDEYEIITKNVINGENFEDRVEIEDEEYITSTTEVAEVKEDIDDVDFILEEEEYYSKEDVVYFTDKDLDEIDFEGLVCIGNEFEEQPLHSLIEDFVIVDAV